MNRITYKKTAGNGKSGYTLLEVVTVMAIMAVLAFITLPSFLPSISQKRIKNTVKEIASVMRLARLKAIRENSNIVISFDPENDGFLDGNYIVFLDNGNGQNKGNSQREEDEPIIKTGMILPGVDLYEAVFGTKPTTRFNGMGLGLAGHVYFRNPQDKYLGIRVSFTGNTRVIESRDKGMTWN